MKFVFLKKHFLNLLSKNNKLSSRRTGRPGGGEQAPRGGVPQAAGRFDLTSTGCRIAASPRERESTRSTGKRASTDRGPALFGAEGALARMARQNRAGRKAAGGGDESAARVDDRKDQPVKRRNEWFRFLTVADQRRRREWMRKAVLHVSLYGCIKKYFG